MIVQVWTILYKSKICTFKWTDLEEFRYRGSGFWTFTLYQTLAFCTKHSSLLSRHPLPKVEFFGCGYYGVDQGHAVGSQRLIVLDQQTLDYGRKPFGAPHLSGDGDGFQGLLVAVGRHQADGSHQLDRLQHDVWQIWHDGPGEEGQGFLVFEHVFQAHLVVHVGLEALDALVLHLVPFGVAERETKAKKILY